MKHYFLILLLMPLLSSGFTIDRAIVATDNNKTYIDFWPIVAQAWKKIGIKPTLAFIAEKDEYIDETIGDVIRFEPIPGIPNGFYAQVIRLLLPLYFQNDVSIISDIDMIPLKKDYFVNSVKNIGKHCFVIYRNGEYCDDKFPMCYVAAKGSIFADIFNIKNIQEIPALVIQWFNLGLGWYTDERLLFQHIVHWKYYSTRCIKLGHKVTKRIDRGYWHYNKDLLKESFYIDAHSLRPYIEHKDKIDALLHEAGIL